jgi:predicted Zn-dependent protease
LGLPDALGVEPLNVGVLERLTKDPDVGPDALLELAYARILERKPENARRLAQQAGGLSAEPWIRYLSHFIAALSHEFQGHYQDAVQEYAAALGVIPHAQSASIALAQLLLRDNQAERAMVLLNRTLVERPDGDDPWRLFSYGAYNRWPVLIADVRKAVR